MRSLPIHPLPAAIEGVIGLSIIRGQSVPIVDLSRLLGRPDGFARFITVRVAERTVALAVTEVLGARSVSADGLPPLLSKSDRGLVRSIGQRDNELLVVLDEGRLVTDAAWAVMDAHAGAPS